MTQYLEWIYHNGYNNSTRYILGIMGKNPLVCFGINPSTAEPNKLDKTIESVERISKSNGFDSWIMLNIYPQRATNPKDIDTSLNYEYHRINLEYIESIFAQGSINIWSAWGTLIETRDFLRDCLFDIYSLSQKYNCDWITTGKESKNGHPHHPLYLKSDCVFRSFSIIEYLDKQNI